MVLHLLKPSMPFLAIWGQRNAIASRPGVRKRKIVVKPRYEIREQKAGLRAALPCDERVE